MRSPILKRVIMKQMTDLAASDLSLHKMASLSLADL